MKKHNKRTGFKSQELEFADKSQGEDYGEVIAPKGNCRFDVKLFSTGEIVNVPIRGKLTHGKTKQRIAPGDIVLLLPDISNPYIITYKYSDDNVKKLRSRGELSQVVVSSTNTTTVAFGSESINKEVDDIEIDDEFIANL
jgi:translation initiation factor IF-1